MDHGPGCTARLMAAIDLAKAHNAHLKGLYTVVHPHYTSSAIHEVSLSAEIRSIFINATSKSGVSAEWIHSDWGIAGVDLNELVIRQAYFSDILLIGSPVADTGHKSSFDFYERLLVGSGKPIIIFPVNVEIQSLGMKILIAWKSGREAARAVHDAIPLLQRSQEVTVLSIVRNQQEADLERQSFAELEQHLLRSGVSVKLDLLFADSKRSIGALLGYIRNRQIDLLVVGGVSYKANRAPILSSFAKELLINCHLPIFCSH